MRRWWEREPVRFECQPQCFKCCLKPGIVCFSDADIRRAATFLQCSTTEFKSEYLVKEGDLWLIDVTEDQPCPFLTLQGCRIHESKPTQCKTYPFWEENLESRNLWKLTALFCPGIGLGSMFPVTAIRKALQVFKM
ncbi:MAG: YkgJ family cysteine cluster protein [Nitrospinales bacterium]